MNLIKKIETIIEFAKKYLTIILIILLVIAVGLAGYFFYRYQNLANLAAIPDKDREIKQLVDEVSKFIVLPSGETPTIATVSDTEKLKDQPFFANAKKGDKVLIFSGARKAILYDPIAKKIIDIAPMNLSASPTP